MSQLLNLLGYDPSAVGNNVLTFTSATANSLNALPQIGDSWQLNDVFTSNTGNYFVNPVGASTLSIENYATEMTTNFSYTVSSGEGGFSTYTVSGLEPIVAAATDLIDAANNFLQHTNRISGVTSVQDDHLSQFPHYDTAIAIGKTILYITNKHDNIGNNAPIIGNFTSILIANTINSMATTMASDYSLVLGSIIPGTLGRPSTTSLSGGQISTITARLINITTTMNTRANSDIAFFLAESDFVQKYNKLKKFNNVGQTESYLLSNFIGTDKIKQRITL
jgi:hypothetical protein